MLTTPSLHRCSYSSFELWPSPIPRAVQLVPMQWLVMPSYTLTLAPCPGQSIVTLVLTFNSSLFYHVRSQVAWSLHLSPLHPQPPQKPSDGSTELLNACQLLLVLQPVLQLLPVLCLPYTLPSCLGHCPTLKMTEDQGRSHLAE